MAIKRGWQRWRIIGLLAALLALVAATTGGASAQTAPSCTATYTIIIQQPGSFTSQLLIQNTGTVPTTGWKVRWTFANGQVVNQTFGSTFTQTGANVTITNASWNGVIAPTRNLITYVLGSWSGVNNPPTGIVCTAT